MKRIVPAAVVLIAVAATAWSGRAAERGDVPAPAAASGELPVAGRDLYALYERVRGRWIPLAAGAWRDAGYDGRLLGYRLRVGRHRYDVWVASRIGRVADFGVEHVSFETGAACREVYEKLLGAFKNRGIVPRRTKGLKPPRPGRGSGGARVSVRQTSVPGGRFEARFERNRGRCKVAFQFITRSRPRGGAPNR